ncbi:MAG: amidohydrolase family protein [Clostridiaceae bacterium]|nr:amidohydrolase family protein [Clostridiaceae bacterium]
MKEDCFCSASADVGKEMIFTNVQIILADRILTGMRLRVECGILSALEVDEPGTLPANGENVRVVDCKGMYLAPGFVDQHCHGGAGGPFMTNPRAATAYHLSHGTTSVMATFCPLPTMAEMRDGVSAIADFYFSDDPLTAAVSGIHMEGPFLSPDFGASKEWSVAPDVETALELQRLARGMRSIWSVAPELSGCFEACRALRTSGEKYLPRFLVGHSAASYEEIMALLPLGLGAATHCTNATGYSIDPTRFGGTREFGVDETVWLTDAISAEVIPDYYGMHVRPKMLELILKIKGDERVIIVTDCTIDCIGSANTVPDAVPAEFNTDQLDVRFNRLGLSGSQLTMDRAAANMRRHTGASLVSIFRMAALNAARFIGIDDTVGSIEVGKRANLVLVDEDINLHGVWLDGHEVARPDGQM